MSAGPVRHKQRNHELAPGIMRFGRSRMKDRSGRWRFIKSGKTVPKEEMKEAKPAVERHGRWYSGEDVPRPIKSRKNRHKLTKLRKSITPGTVLILLAGQFRGKRVVFLKQLDSGLLLVTGPYKINGVPLRRVNQRYVIATSTKMDVSAVDVSNINNEFFEKAKEVEEAGEASVFAEKSEKKVSQALKDETKRVNDLLMPVIEKTPLLKHYLNAKFSLRKGQFPHEMKF